MLTETLTLIPEYSARPERRFSKASQAWVDPWALISWEYINTVIDVRFIRSRSVWASRGRELNKSAWVRLCEFAISSSNQKTLTNCHDTIFNASEFCLHITPQHRTNVILTSDCRNSWSWKRKVDEFFSRNRIEYVWHRGSDWRTWMCVRSGVSLQTLHRTCGFHLNKTQTMEWMLFRAQDRRTSGNCKTNIFPLRFRVRLCSIPAKKAEGQTETDCLLIRRRYLCRNGKPRRSKGCYFTDNKL